MDLEAYAERKLGELDERIRDLQRVKRAVRKVVGELRCGESLAGPCPILASLGGPRAHAVAGRGRDRS